MTIANRTTFKGKPIITTPTVLGCPPDKPYFYRVSAIGTRPITITVTGLPKGLIYENQIIRGTPTFTGCFMLTVKAENAEGTAEKTVRLEVFKGCNQRTPLMGFCSWNAYDTHVSQENMIDTAQYMTDSGLIDHGYHYVNLDSSWQGEYGGKFDAIQPCDRFPDMKGMVAKLHSMGYKVGIYSSPFLEPWGCPADRPSIPGCTLGQPDYRFPNRNRGIGVIRKEKENVAQWTDWDIDYLKYDWTPTDTYNADIMRQALNESTKDFIYCVTVTASAGYADYWKRNLNSWRCGGDTNGTWVIEKGLFDSYNTWQEHTGYGHYYDLDMLFIGQTGLRPCKLTDDEKIFEYSVRAFLVSPIQLSCRLQESSEFELDLYSNEEVIAINQDGQLCPAKCKFEENDLKIYEKPLDGGDLGVGIFNASDEERTIEYALPAEGAIRDLWAKEDLGKAEKITATLAPHTAMLYRVGF